MNVIARGRARRDPRRQQPGEPRELWITRRLAERSADNPPRLGPPVIPLPQNIASDARRHGPLSAIRMVYPDRVVDVTEEARAALAAAEQADGRFRRATNATEEERDRFVADMNRLKAGIVELDEGIFAYDAAALRDVAAKD
jgi:hypothetical protein